jgi:pimeloyl-ACP methyl ester carboxylesterase
MVQDPIIDSTIVLADGRRIAHADFGPENATPLIYVHGYPGSRIDLCRDDLLTPLAEAGYRLIGLDQPGFGRTPFVPGRTYSDWAEDVDEVATRLGLGRFALLAWSAGAMFALACSARFPERIDGFCLLSPAAPSEMPGWRKSWRRDVRMMIAINRRVPALGRALLGANARRMRTESGAVKGFSKFVRSSVDDQEIRAYPDWALRFAREADRQGPAAFVELARRQLDWPPGFRLGGIEIPVALFHGDADNLAPISHSHFIAEQLPGAQLEEIPGHGHVPTPGVLDRIAQALPLRRPQHA